MGLAGAGGGGGRCRHPRRGRAAEPQSQAIPGALRQPVPKLDRVDRWLYDQYQLGNLDRAQITQAVIEGRELTDPRLRPAAHGLAAAMLTGQVGVLTRRTERKLLGAVLGLIIAIAAVAVATGKFAMLVPVATGVALLPVSARMWTRDRRRVEGAHQLNAQAPRHVPIRPTEDAPDSTRFCSCLRKLLRRTNCRADRRFAIDARLRAW